MIKSCMQKPKTEPPFFIVGSGRSGTTLLQVLLDAHANIAIPPESHIFDRFRHVGDPNKKWDDPAKLRDLVKDLLHDKKIKAWQLDITEQEFCQLLPEKTFREAVNLVFSLYAKKKGKSRWGDKTPKHIFYLREIKAMFPDAKIIHLVRDGRDVAESLKRVYFGPKRIDKMAEVWKGFVNTACVYAKKVGPEEYLEIRYEDLVRNKDEVMKAIFNFLGETECPGGSQAKEKGVSSFYMKAPGIHGSLDGPVDETKIGLFKKGLSYREIEIFETLAKAELQRYGYQLMTKGKAKIGRGEKILLSAQDLWGRVLSSRQYILQAGFYRSVYQMIRRRFKATAF